MNQSVYKVLSPLLLINFVFGLRIVYLPISHPKPWFGVFYILLLWLIYCVLRVHITIEFFTLNVYHTIDIMTDFTLLLSILFGMYHNKKFKNCLKKLAIVDTTLENLGIITNYQPLRKRIIWIILGWFVITILLNTMQIIITKEVYKCNTITAIYFSNVYCYFDHITFLSDLTITSIIGYVGIKFDQINEHLKNMANNNKYGIIQAWDNTVLHTPQRQFAHNPSNKWMIWIIIHLHLELRNISRELDSIFGVEMTFKMGSYFIFTTLSLYSLFYMIFIPSDTNYIVLFKIITILSCFRSILKFITINLVCEKVSNQANSTKNFLRKILQFMNDVETCENITQLLLHIKQSPLRFCGIGLFQFGYKFVYGFVSSVGTVLVILIQSYTESEN